MSCGKYLKYANLSMLKLIKIFPFAFVGIFLNGILSTDMKSSIINSIYDSEDILFYSYM